MREPLTALGSHQVGFFNFCVHSTPLREQKVENTKLSYITIATRVKMGQMGEAYRRIVRAT